MEDLKFWIDIQLYSYETIEDIFNIHHEGEIEFVNKDHIFRYFKDFRFIYDKENLIYKEYFSKKL